MYILNNKKRYHLGDDEIISIIKNISKLICSIDHSDNKSIFFEFNIFNYNWMRNEYFILSFDLQNHHAY